MVDLRLEHHTYLLDIAIEKAFVEGWDTFSFMMFGRYQSEYVMLPYIKKSETKDFFIFEIKIAVDSFFSFFIEGETIDLSIFREAGNDGSRSRIKSHYDYLEFFTLPLNESYILRPITTREGNVSFYVRENNLRALVDEAYLSKQGVLKLMGIYHFPTLKFEEIRGIEILLAVNGTSVQLPVQPKMLPDEYAQYAWFHERRLNGFRADIDLKSYMQLEQVNHIKFQLIITYERDGEEQLIESARIKVNHWRRKYPIKRKVSHGRHTFQINVKPTRKAKYLSVKVEAFKLRAELIRSVKNNWVSIRRSKQLLKMYQSVFYVVGRIVPPNEKLVMFESFHGKQFSDNPRAIYEYMKENLPDYSLVWSVDRRHMDYFKDRGVHHVRRFSIHWLLHMTRARYWVVNARLPLWIPKPSHTIYVQTWHGTPLKRLAADMDEVHMPGTNTAKYKKNFVYEAGKWDYLVSPNAYSTTIFRRAFQFDRNIIESGYPRNDYLFAGNDEANIRCLKRELGTDEQKKVILYAPTWRDNQFYGKGRYKFDIELDLNKLQAEFGETHVIVLRMHYLVAENIDISAFKGFVYDFSSHEDIRDLYLISDILITDYSSVFFDYANLQRPMIFFVYDIEDYRDNLRGFYFNFEEKAPGPLTRTTEDIIEAITKIEEEGFIPSLEYSEFYNRFCYLEDGHASARVVKEIFGK